jgi:Asp-tRNA(Asn)/Glu-tRNA(Gln) amidotransferase A subunit family amidase
MEELLSQSAMAMARRIRQREVSPVEIVQAYLDRIAKINPKINAVVTVIAEEALAAARQAEAAVMRGKKLGLFHGVPFTVKDAIATAGVRSTDGTLLLADYVPSQDATAVARMRAAGAILLGKTNVPEFGLDYRTDNRVFGRTNNPWDLERTPGGSSGGEAAAIAACASSLGVASDMGGSIRIPAHFTGVVSLKPTKGWVPLSGHLPERPSTNGWPAPAPGSLLPSGLMTTIGPISRRVEDLFPALQVMAGPDDRDPTVVQTKLIGPRTVNVKKIRVAWFVEDGHVPVREDIQKVVEQAAAALQAAGLKVCERRPAGLAQAHEIWEGLIRMNVQNFLLLLCAGREADLHPATLLTLAKVKAGPPITLERYLQLCLARDALWTEVRRFMNDFDVLLCPVVPVPAISHAQTPTLSIRDKEVDYVQAFSLAQAVNLLNCPAAAVPAGRSQEGLPVGVQIVGRPFEEHVVLAVAAELEQRLGGWVMPPELGVGECRSTNVECRIKDL